MLRPSWRGLATLLLLLSVCASGQTLPGLQIIEPNPGDGRPLLVREACTDGRDGETWEKPILVYSDLNVESFVDRPCLIAAVQMGFERDGRYVVALYTHFKAGYFCRTLPPKSAANPEIMRECRLVVYKSRLLYVDTRNKMIRMSEIYLLGEDGHHLTTLPDDHRWDPISSLHPSLSVTVNHITALVEAELERWKRVYGSH